MITKAILDWLGKLLLECCGIVEAVFCRIGVKKILKCDRIQTVIYGTLNVGVTISR